MVDCHISTRSRAWSTCTWWRRASRTLALPISNDAIRSCESTDEAVFAQAVMDWRGDSHAGRGHAGLAYWTADLSAAGGDSGNRSTWRTGHDFAGRSRLVAKAARR